MDIVKPIYTIPERTGPDRFLEDKRATNDLTIITDFFTIPASVEPVIYMRLVEVPLGGIPLPGHGLEDIVVEFVATGQPLNRKYTGLPQTGQFLAEGVNDQYNDTFKFGYIGFSTEDAGKEVRIMYYGRGSLVTASDVNELATGALIRDRAIRPRHIYQGGVGPDGLTGSSDFYFATNVDVGGNLNVTGDLNIAGVVNKSISEVIDVTDDILKLNSGATSPGPDVGIEVDRGGANPQLLWNEATDAWHIKGTTGEDLLTISDNKTVKIVDGGLFKPPTLAVDPTPTIDMIPGTYYCAADNQYKGIVWNAGHTGAEIIILG